MGVAENVNFENKLLVPSAETNIDIHDPITSRSMGVAENVNFLNQSWLVPSHETKVTIYHQELDETVIGNEGSNNLVI